MGGKEGALPTGGKDPTQKGLWMIGTEMVKTLFCNPLILLQVYYVWCILYFLAWSSVKPLCREDPVFEEEENYSISGHGRRDGNSLSIRVRDRCHGEREERGKRREESRLRTLRSLVKEGDVARGCWSPKLLTRPPWQLLNRRTMIRSYKRYRSQSGTNFCEHELESYPFYGWLIMLWCAEE